MTNPTVQCAFLIGHYGDVIMGAMASQITSWRLFTQSFIQAQIKENIKAPRHWPLCAGNSPGTGQFPAQMASNEENVFIWWRHHGFCTDTLIFPYHLTASINTSVHTCCLTYMFIIWSTPVYGDIRTILPFAQLPSGVLIYGQGLYRIPSPTPKSICGNPKPPTWRVLL